MLKPTDYPSIGAMLVDALMTHKTNVALVEYDRDRLNHELTYLQTWREVTQFIGLLEQRELKAGDHVAIMMTNRSSWLIAAIAVFAKNFVLVPIDYKLSKEEQAHLLKHSDAKLLITETPLLKRLGTLVQIPALYALTDKSTELGPQTTEWELLVNKADETLPVLSDETRTQVLNDRREVNGRPLATIVYSSGTGGPPKGCMLSHQAYLFQLEALIALFPLRPHHRYFSFLPTNHAIDFMLGFLAPMYLGMSVVHQRTLRPEFLASTMVRAKVTHFTAVPLLLEALLAKIESSLVARPTWQQKAIEGLTKLNQRLTEVTPKPVVSRTLLKPIHDAFGGNIEMIFCGGAFTPKALAERFYALGLPVVIGYGLTECCTVATTQDLKPFRADSVGRAVPGVTIKIKADEIGSDNQAVGEVLITGPTVMLGYYKDQALTNEHIMGGWLQTGDRGYLDGSGHLHLVGRSKNMIVTKGGKNVYPEDIEQAFAKIKAEDFAVMSSSFLYRSSVAEQEHLILVVKSDEPPTSITQAVQNANRTLADFKRVTQIVFWPTPFPRTASMKIKRSELADAIRSSGEQPVDLVRSSVTQNGARELST